MFRGSLKKSLLIFTVFLIAFLSIGYALANHYFNQLIIDRTTINQNIINNEHPKDTTPKDKENKDEAPSTTSILLLGTDKSAYLTDSMLALQIDYKTKTVSMFSIPRDYRIELSKDVQKLIKHYSSHIKITELHSYAKAAKYESPISLTAQASEEILGFKFDHIVLFNLQAFRNVVDAVGGVEVYVPQNMNYSDPTQNLRINLKRGTQVLDGKKAEGFLRYRKNNNNVGYGDFGRMEVQQYFLKEFVKKLISVESAMNFNEIFDSIKDFVKTDANLNDALYLITRAKDLDMDRIYSHTLPGSNKIVNGIYFYNPPSIEELHRLVKEQIDIDRRPNKSSNQYDITILNGTGKGKMASKYEEKLTTLGYNVIKIGDFYGTKTIKTQIIVPSNDIGQDLKAYFNLSEIIVDSEKEDITIILGKIEE